METQPPIRIEQTTENKCYSCGRSSNQVLNTAAMKKIIQEEIAKRNKQRESGINTLMNLIKQLYENLESSPQDINVSDIGFLPSTRPLTGIINEARKYINLPDCKVGELRIFLHQLIKDLNNKNLQSLTDEAKKKADYVKHSKF